MSSRARQLLLEVLLLAEKYSDRDVSWVREQLSLTSRSGRIAMLLELASREQNFSEPRKASAKQTPHREVSPIVKKVTVIEGLKKHKGTYNIRRAENIAQRLKITLRGQTHEELVHEIEDKLNNLNEKDLTIFLRPYKDSGEVDEAYIGLAKELMKPSSGKDPSQKL